MYPIVIKMTSKIENKTPLLGCRFIIRLRVNTFYIMIKIVSFTNSYASFDANICD